MSLPQIVMTQIHTIRLPLYFSFNKQERTQTNQQTNQRASTYQHIPKQASKRFNSYTSNQPTCLPTNQHVALFFTPWQDTLPGPQADPLLLSYFSLLLLLPLLIFFCSSSFSSPFSSCSSYYSSSSSSSSSSFFFTSFSSTFPSPIHSSSCILLSSSCPCSSSFSYVSLFLFTVISLTYSPYSSKCVRQNWPHSIFYIISIFSSLPPTASPFLLSLPFPLLGPSSSWCVVSLWTLGGLPS